MVPCGAGWGLPVVLVVVAAGALPARVLPAVLLGARWAGVVLPVGVVLALVMDAMPAGFVLVAAVGVLPAGIVLVAPRLG
jgi:hypothetical protein